MSVTRPTLGPRSELPSASFARRVTDKPVLSPAAQLTLSLGLSDGPATGSKAVG